jgi:NADH:ubiquinone oxidoreductase subunit 3 (subunit A)
VNTLIYLNYLDILVFWFIVLTIIVIIIILIKLLSNYNITKEKLSIYECGFETINTTRLVFEIHFIAIAVLYLIFDLEIIILIPAILNYYNIDLFGVFFFFDFYIVRFPF